MVLAAVSFAALIGAASIASAQDPGYALQFDGVSDYVRLAATSTIMAPGWETTKTVSLWVKPTGSAACTGPDPATCDTIFGDRPRAWGIGRGTVGGLDRIWVWNFDGTVDRVGIEYTVGEWTQVALVHGGGWLSAYKNGVLVGSVRSGATPSASGQSVLHFGGIISNATLNWTFSGDIDELQIWNVARSATDIAQDWNLPLSGSEVGLAAYYRMSDGSGTTLTDDSGHLQTGALKDGASGVPADGPISWVPSGAFGVIVTTNTPPVADPQSVSTEEEIAVPITLSGTDADNDALTFAVASQPSRGSLSGTAPDLVYTPFPDASGTDQFTFVANDGHVDSAPATITVTILGINDPPAATDDSASTRVDTAVVVAVLANDSDADGDVLAVGDVGTPSNGVVANNGTTITYTPNTGYTGSDSFGYTASDGNGGTSTATVTVTITALNDAGMALRFDGTSDFVSLAPAALIMAPSWQSTKTVSLWAKPMGMSFCYVATPPECDSIFGDRPQWWGITRGTVGGLERIWVWNYDGSIDRIGIEYTPGEWIHIAMVHEGGWLRAYKNGVLTGSIPSGDTRQPNTGAFPVLTFGGIIMATKNWTFEGAIDEVRIWNIARSASEILGDMNQELVGTEPGLAAYYKMSDGSGTSLTDNSGHGWTGTLKDGYQQIPADGPILWIPSDAFSLFP